MVDREALLFDVHQARIMRKGGQFLNGQEKYVPDVRIYWKMVR